MLTPSERKNFVTHEPTASSSKVRNIVPFRYSAISILLLVTVGALITLWTVSRTDQEMRRDLSAQAQLLMQAIDLGPLKNFTGSDDDLANPSYQRLKAQLVRAKQASNCRFIYLVGRKPDGSLFFFVDSENIDAKDYSPPGQAYLEAPAAFSRVFSSGTETVEGPYKDRWGTWVSGLIPMRDRNSSGQGLATLAVLGMDMDASAWSRSLAWAALPPSLCTLLLASVLSLGFWLLARRARIVGARPRWMRHFEPVLAATAGLILSVFFGFRVHQIETRARNEAFAQLAASRTDEIAKELRDLRDARLEGFASFYENSERIDREAFRRFSAYLTKGSTVQAWEWVPSVAEVDRSQFEIEEQAGGHKGYKIWQKGSAGNPEPATGRGTLYPVFQVAPLTGNEETIGYDLGSEALRRAAIDEAKRTGLPTIGVNRIVGPFI